jgi:hypothetical protein
MSYISVNSFSTKKIYKNEQKHKEQERDGQSEQNSDDKEDDSDNERTAFSKKKESFFEKQKIESDRFHISRFLAKTKSTAKNDAVFCSSYKNNFLIFRSEQVLNCYTLIYIDQDGCLDEEFNLTPEEEKIFTFEMKKLNSNNGIYYLTKSQYYRVIFPYLRDNMYT